MESTIGQNNVTSLISWIPNHTTRSPFITSQPTRATSPCSFSTHNNLLNPKKLSPNLPLTQISKPFFNQKKKKETQ